MSSVLKRLFLDGMEFIKIEAGQFHMGKNEIDPYARELETSHFVKISYPFYMLKTPVTVGQYRRFVKEENINTSYLIEKWDGNDWVTGPYFDEINTNSNYPVVGVSYYDAMNYITWLSKYYSVDFRLPTEAEFEYASRSGCTCKSICKYAKIARNLHYDRREEEKPRKKSFSIDKMIENEYGLLGMHCSIWQWCSDWYYYYDITDIQNDPRGPEEMPKYAPWKGERWKPGKVIRGGSFSYPFYYSRCSDRHYSLVTDRNYNLGFRIVLQKEQADD